MQKNILLVSKYLMLVTILASTLTACGLYNKQSELGEKLGVDYHNYPPSENFPFGYFAEVLEPGMNIDDVHKIVIEYVKVINCENTREIYYYYHSSDKKATRIMIIYNGNMTFKKVVPEDKDSLSFDVTSCRPGLLGKQVYTNP